MSLVTSTAIPSPGALPPSTGTGYILYNSKTRRVLWVSEVATYTTREDVDKFFAALGSSTEDSIVWTIHPDWVPVRNARTGYLYFNADHSLSTTPPNQYAYVDLLRGPVAQWAHWMDLSLASHAVRTSKHHDTLVRAVQSLVGVVWSHLNRLESTFYATDWHLRLPQVRRNVRALGALPDHPETFARQLIHQANLPAFKTRGRRRPCCRLQSCWCYLGTGNKGNYGNGGPYVGAGE